MEREVFILFFQKTMQEGNTLDLPSLLIMPIQRIPRYRLLFEELLKETPEDHLDYDDIKAALKEIEVCSSCLWFKVDGVLFVVPFLRFPILLHLLLFVVLIPFAFVCFLCMYVSSRRLPIT